MGDGYWSLNNMSLTIFLNMLLVAGYPGGSKCGPHKESRVMPSGSLYKSY